SPSRLPPGEISMNLPTLRLKSNCDRRLRAGHLWVFSNEVDTAQTPLTALAAGDEVQVLNASGKLLGLATVSPDNLICARLHSREVRCGLDKVEVVDGVQLAVGLRARLIVEGFSRQVQGHADALPGVVADRVAAYLVVQIAHVGRLGVRGDIAEALVQVLRPEG